MDATDELTLEPHEESQTLSHNGSAAAEPPETLDSEQPHDEDTASGERLVPVSEARRYRKRAQSAEKRVRELETQVQRGNEALAEREQQLKEMSEQGTMDEALREHGAIDIELARLLVERECGVDQEKDVPTIVAELRQRKPYLFRPRASHRSGTVLGPRPDTAVSATEGRLEDAAEAAIASGKRVDVLRYLRLRRKR